MAKKIVRFKVSATDENIVEQVFPYTILKEMKSSFDLNKDFMDKPWEYREKKSFFQFDELVVYYIQYSDYPEGVTLDKYIDEEEFTEEFKAETLKLMREELRKELQLFADNLQRKLNQLVSVTTK